MRNYLVVIDESDESALAMRFAARRAARTGGKIHVLAIVPQQEFVAWGGAQATMEEEARSRAEALVAGAAGTLMQENGMTPSITVRQGNGVDVVRDVIAENADITALVLGAAASGNPGPLVSHFAGTDAGTLPCPLTIVPGSLTLEDIDRLS
ncbi:MAG: universal stress protein [Sphingomonadales bacterium]|nr:universal stress protein [Sphingomonadales bacterium]